MASVLHTADFQSRAPSFLKNLSVTASSMSMSSWVAKAASRTNTSAIPSSCRLHHATHAAFPLLKAERLEVVPAASIRSLSAWLQPIVLVATNV